MLIAECTPTRGRISSIGIQAFGARRDPFTLIEVVVVLLIMGLALALIVPRSGRVPARVAVANALSTVRTAARDAGMHARATGSSCRLVLSPNSHTWRLQSVAASASEAGGASLHPLDLPTSYEVSTEVVWHLADDERTMDGVVIEFFPDGSATGPPVAFTVRRRRFRLEVDRLTGRPDIVEEEP